MTRTLTVQEIARICHTANRAYCASLGDSSQPAWEDAPQWQIDSALAGVQAILEGRITTPRQSHEGWLREKVSAGWTYGPVKDPAAKQHPSLVAYDALSADEKAKDAIFFAIVQGCR